MSDGTQPVGRQCHSPRGDHDCVPGGWLCNASCLHECVCGVEYDGTSCGENCEAGDSADCCSVPRLRDAGLCPRTEPDLCVRL